MQVRWIVVTLFYAACAKAATFNVPGDAATVQGGANLLSPGDTLIVATNTYNERVTISDHNVTIRGVNTPTVRGFDISGRAGVKIVGFEITQADGQDYPAILMSGTAYCQVYNNIIGPTYGGSSYGVRMTGSSQGHSNQIVGNRFSFIKTNAPGGEVAIILFGHYNLVEYNYITRVGDFMNVWGSNNIIRNNFWGICNTNDFPGTDHHIDGIQWFPDSDSTLWRTVVEANRMYSNYLANAHFFIIQRTSADASQHFTVRRNVVNYHGSEVFAANPFTGTYHYHNTVADATIVTAANYFSSAGTRDGFHTTNWHMLGNIIARGCRPTGSGGILYDLETGGLDIWGNYNLRFQSGTPVVAEPNGIEADPLFTDDPAGAARMGDLTLQASSPAINAMPPLSTANGAGVSTTTLIVNSNVQYFCDGFGIADGDWIAIGSGSPVQITAINDGTSTITLSAARSWSDDDGIWSATPTAKMDDIGAYERRAGGYALTATYSVGGTTYTAVPNDTDICRMVIFYQDGVPHTRDYSSPYTATIASGVVTVRAYPRFASDTLFAEATESGQAEGSDGVYRNRGRSTRSAGVIP